MEHDWKKDTLKQAVAAKTLKRQIWRVILKGVTFFWRRYDTFSQIVW